MLISASASRRKRQSQSTQTETQRSSAAAASPSCENRRASCENRQASCYGWVRHMMETETQNRAEDLTTEELVRLLSVLSHDLKSPIFTIDGFSELLLGDYQDKLDDEGKDFLRRIRSSVQQMRKVLDEMSHMVKMLARPTIKRPTPLREIVEEVLL